MDKLNRDAYYRISINRVEVFDDLTLDDANEIKCNENVKYIQISKEISRQTLVMINHVILAERPDIQFRVYGFYRDKCDLGFLEELTDVVDLSVGEMVEADNLDALGKLKKLKRLRVCLDKLDDLSFLGNINSNISSLMIGTGLTNRKLDMSIIDRFSVLDTLFLYRINQGYDVLKNMKFLRTLTINACRINEFAFLKETSVNNLSLGLVRNNDLSSLEGNENIRKLELQRLSGLQDLNVLPSLSNLEECKVSHNSHIEMVPDMRSCKNIKALLFDSLKKLRDISGLAFIPNVERIEMYQIKLADLPSIENILRNPSLRKFKCTTGSLKKDKQISSLIKEYDKL